MDRRTSVLSGCSAWLLIVAANATVSLGGYFDYVNSLSPTVYYRLDEARPSVGTAYDSMSNHYDSVYNASANASIAGVVPGNNAVYNSGAWGAVDLDTYSDSIFAAGATPFTVSLWVKPDSFGVGNYGTPFSYGATGTGRGIIIAEHGGGSGAGNGSLEVGRIGLASDIYSTGVMTAGAWNHIGLTYDGSTLQLYLNGRANGSWSGTLDSGTTYGWLGCYYGSGAQQFAGGLDEFAYWNGTALSAPQMEKLAYVNYSVRVKSLNPAGYYRLNETTIGTVYDSSGNGRDAFHATPPNPSLNQTPGALAPSESDSAIGGTGAVVNFSGVASTLFATGNDPFSFSMWVKPNGFSAQPWGTMFSYGNAAPGQALIIAEQGILKDGTLDIGAYYHGLFSSVGKLVDQQWNQIGMTYDGSILSLYLNGKFDSSITTTLTTGSGSGLLGDLIGGGQPFNGQIDEFAYFHTALSAADMADLATVPEPSTIVLLAVGLIGLLAYAWRRRN